MEIKHPKLFQYYARLLPPIFFLYWGIGLSIKWPLDTFGGNMSIGAAIVYTIGVLLFGSYLVLTYWFLPPLIYPYVNDTWLKHILSQLFTAATVGLGPVILYWIFIDKWFTKYIQEKGDRFI